MNIMRPITFCVKTNKNLHYTRVHAVSDIFHGIIEMLFTREMLDVYTCVV